MMGENLVVFYKQRLRKEHKQAFFAAFFIGLLVHIYINSPTICRTMIRCFTIFLIRILLSPGDGRCPRHAR